MTDNYVQVNHAFSGESYNYLQTIHCVAYKIISENSLNVNYSLTGFPIYSALQRALLSTVIPHV